MTCSFITFQIIPFVEKTFTFEDVPRAFEKVKAGHNRGKTVIDVIGSQRNDDVTERERKDNVTGSQETHSEENKPHQTATS